ncbi:MAG: hypothetical protein KBS77_02460 [Bacteroidales bacterium]|nr:hypothetical protein [Candidatus Colicola faecequi]
MNRFIPFLIALSLALPIVAQNGTYEDDIEEQQAQTTRVQLRKNRQQNTTVTKATYNGFSGGMMLHLGYQAGRGAGFPNQLTDPVEETVLRSITYGIGGMARVHLMRHMHVGMEGYVSTMPLKSQGDGSNIRSGWGGVLADYYTPISQRCQFIAGGTLGGGAQRNLHVFTEENSQIIGDSFQETWNNFIFHNRQESTSPASYTKRGFFVIDPYIALEYAVTDRIHMIFKLDYLLATHRQAFLTPSGPRLYIGFMFGH